MNPLLEVFWIITSVIIISTLVICFLPQILKIINKITGASKDITNKKLFLKKKPMGIINRVINVFEKRIKELNKTNNITNLPKWTDADLVGAVCLLEEYHKLINNPHTIGIRR